MFCNSNELPGDAYVAGLQPAMKSNSTLWTQWSSGIMSSCALSITDRFPLEPFKMRTTSLVLKINLLAEKQGIRCGCYALPIFCVGLGALYIHVGLSEAGLAGV